jgi:DNA-binding NtrC family response regulator
MQLRVSDPHLLPELLSYLRERPDVVAQQTNGHIAVSLLGSRDWNENVRELEERLEPWRARNVGILVEVKPAS